MGMIRLALALSLLAGAARATVFVDNGTVKINNEITLQDAVYVANYRVHHDLTRLLLNSPGGNFQAALMLMDMVRADRTATRVPTGGTCASSCALIFLAGTQKSIGASAKVGLHGPYTETWWGDTKPMEPRSMEVWAHTVGLPVGWVQRALTYRTDEMWWLTRGELAQLSVISFP